MKHSLTFLLFLTLLFASPTAEAAIAVPVPPANTERSDDSAQTLSRGDLEATLGRKLTLRERISFSIAKRKARRAEDQTENTGNGMAIAGFVCAVVGLFVFGVILGPLGIIFSAIGMGKSKREGRPLRGLAIAGLVIGIVATIGGLIVIAAIAST